jgi:hypothetical protein
MLFVCPKSGGHATAFVCTLPACLCTFLAMFGLMLAAFFTTSLAHIGTQAAKLFGLFAAKTHELSGCITKGSAFHIQLNAAGHHFHVFFLRARRGAVITNSRAAETGVDAVFVRVITSHKKKFSVSQ